MSLPPALAVSYAALLRNNTLRPDSAQAQAIRKLVALEQSLIRPGAGKKRSWPGFRRHRPNTTPRGVYLHGGVGRGKSMLMDLFHDSIHQRIPGERIHFHAFMLRTHQDIARLRKKKIPDPLRKVAADIAAKNRLLCFDEFFVHDITDAMILGRLFEALFAQGVVVVATSNFAIDKLYEHGLQRAQFLPFIHLFQERMVSHFLDSPTDHRQEILQHTKRFFRNDEAHAYHAAHQRLIAHLPETPLEVESFGRKLTFANVRRNTLRCSFNDLCALPLGAADYLRIFARIGIVFLDDVPPLGGGDHDDLARRFLYLIDCLYERQVQLFLLTTSDLKTIKDIYPAGRLAFEFARAGSRLTEMQSADYGKSRAGQ